MKKLLFLVLSLAIFSIAFANFISESVAVSDSLKTVSCLITATNYSHRTTTIEYIFKFKRKNKMYIQYIKPANMAGAKIAMDGTYFYNYIPNLHRLMKKKIIGSKNNPGKEMGILYAFISGDMKNFLKEKTIKCLKESDKTIKYQISSSLEKEIVIFDKATYFPIEVDIYKHNKITLKMKVDKIVLNQPLKDSEFVLEK